MFTAREKLSGSRKTIQNYSINKPVRFATQYCGDTDISSTLFNSDYELIRTKEKYKIKCEEIDMKKNQLNSDHLDLEFRAEKLRQSENEVRQLTFQLKKKLKYIKQQEQQLKENQITLTQQFKEKELIIQEQMNLLQSKTEQINFLEQQLNIRQQAITEKESLLEEKINYYTQLNERLRINNDEVNKKEQFYFNQIKNMNQTVESIIKHENLIRQLAFDLTQELQSLKEFDNQIIYQIQHCKFKDDMIEQKEMNIQKSQELINRKMLWDQKNYTRQHLQQVSNFMSEQKYF